MNTNIILYIALGCFFLLAGWLGYTEWRLKKLFRGKKASDLENVLQLLGNDLKNLQTSQKETEDYLKEVEERLKKSLKKVGIVRYNPYSETVGSNQSFSLAFLDEKGNGAVISGLYNRGNIKIYAKPIQEYKSEYTLSEEENEAIWKTKQKTI
jgi:hypothetical protein